MPSPPLDDLPPPAPGARVHTASRLVRFGDLDVRGDLRFDALAAYLQDVAGDDTADAGLGDDPAWVVRRTVVERWWPARFRERLTVRTFCSGVGPRWAERRISVRGELGAAVEASALWIRFDPATGRPAPLDPRFLEVWGRHVADRRPSTRLAHPAEVPVGAVGRPWPLRHADLDPLGHVNNAAAWSIVDEAVGDHPALPPALRVEVEHRAPIERHDELEVACLDEGRAGLRLWALAGGPAPLRLTARITPLGGSPPA